MKKLVLFLAAGLALTTTACNRVDRKEARKIFVSSCLQSGGANGQVPKALLQEYCDCSADRVIDQSSDEELRGLKDVGNDPAKQQRILELAKPCIETLQQKMAGQTAAPAQ